MQVKKQSVLVVDDDPMSRHLLKAILVSAGLDVIECSSGTQCLDSLERETPAMILLDVMMPDTDGFHVLSEIRRYHAADALPVILVTACSEEKDIVRGLTSGANDYLIKPFERTTFLARVYNHLTLSQMRKNVDERKERLSNLLDVQKALGDMIPEAIMVHNQEGVVLYRNEMLQKMCGGDPHAQAHQVLLRFFPLDLIAAMEREFVKTKEGVVEKEFCLLNSQMKHLLVRSAVVELKKSEYARIWSFRDVTKLRVLEADTHAQVAACSVGKFAGEVSDYMKALLSHVSDLTSQLAGVQANNTLACRYLDSIDRLVTEGREFSDKVKAIAEPQLYVSSVSEDLNEVLRVVVEAAQLSIGSRITFDLEADSHLPRVPLTMRSLSSIFGNVLSNAVDAIDGDGWIKIAVHADSDMGKVRIRFEDSGNGMGPEVVERVCDPFFTTKSFAPEGVGLKPLKGLGMWNVYNMVRAIGGDVSLSSEVGSGTRVIVDIPSVQP